jgi:hypothetical protein
MFFRRSTPGADSSNLNTTVPNVSTSHSAAGIPGLFSSGPGPVQQSDPQLMLEMLFQQQQALQVQMNQVCLALHQIQVTLGHVNTQLSAEKPFLPNMSRGGASESIPQCGVGRFEPSTSRDDQAANLSHEFTRAAAASNEGAPSTPVSTPPSVPQDPPRRSPSKGNRSVDDSNVSRQSSLIQPWNPRGSNTPSAGSTPNVSRSGSVSQDAPNPLVGRGASWFGVPEVQPISAGSKERNPPQATSSGSRTGPLPQKSAAVAPHDSAGDEVHRPRIIAKEPTLAYYAGRTAKETPCEASSDMSSAALLSGSSAATTTGPGDSFRQIGAQRGPPSRSALPRGVHDVSLDSDGYGSYESKAYMKSIGLL